MRQNIEFDAPIEDGKIVVPAKYRSAVQGASQAHITVISEVHAEEGRDYIDELLEHPLKLPNFKKLTRDEMHER